MKTQNIAIVKVTKCRCCWIMSLRYIRITFNLIFNTTSTLIISAISFLLSMGKFYLHYKRFIITLAFNFNLIYKFYSTKRCIIHNHYYLGTITIKFARSLSLMHILSNIHIFQTFINKRIRNATSKNIIFCDDIFLD